MAWARSSGKVGWHSLLARRRTIQNRKKREGKLVNCRRGVSRWPFSNPQCNRRRTCSPFAPGDCGPEGPWPVGAGIAAAVAKEVKGPAEVVGWQRPWEPEGPRWPEGTRAGPTYCLGARESGRTKVSGGWSRTCSSGLPGTSGLPKLENWGPMPRPPGRSVQGVSSPQEGYVCACASFGFVF